MLFNSFNFFIFFLIVLALYAGSTHRIQNIILLASSYYFYANWDYRFLILLTITISVDFFSASAISSCSSALNRKIILICSIACNLSILLFFKYCNFFIDSFAILAGGIGYSMPQLSMQIILPVGISFYTFKSMSYTIDVYKRNSIPTNNFIDYAIFVSFFPQLIAGPIERSSQLLHQISRKRIINFQKLQDGCFYIFWGLFLKVFIADNLAKIVDPIFSSPSDQTGFAYLIGGYAYTFQIYGDFAGYSYMAMGFGSILGFEVMNNFNLPYFAHNPQEFWRRWHISLSTWFRDYLYIPLGGSRGTMGRTIRNLLVTMLLCGLWHGAQMTFVLWGMVHGILLAGHHFLKRSRVRQLVAKNSPDLMHFLKIGLFFHVIVLSWYFFRANSVSQVQNIFLSFIYNFSFSLEEHYIIIKQLLFYSAPLIFIEFCQFYRGDISPIRQFPVPIRGILYVLVFYLVIIFGATDAQNFIYLQF